ncbi:class I SAM-dependent methyltransferase [Candidatus Azambacteria bacterium]|nr:class I SAM-dependent methyltransferase [Candidatus Azambacteria bacterium]
MSVLLTVGAIGVFITMVMVTYFFTVTRFSLVVQGLAGKNSPSSHIYWIYKSRPLIWITDRQPIISAILLWNYDRLVGNVVNRLGHSLHGKDVLQLSCAFGNISEKIAERCAWHKANLVIADVIANELAHTKNKLDRRGLQASFKACDATALPYPDKSFDCVISFFLFHELPLEKKREVLKESMRVMKPGGKIICGEFHRPRFLLLRITGKIFFTVFEKYAGEMWGTFNPEAEIRMCAGSPDKWKFSQKTFFGGNYCVFEAEKTPR